MAAKSTAPLAVVPKRSSHRRCATSSVCRLSAVCDAVCTSGPFETTVTRVDKGALLHRSNEISECVYVIVSGVVVVYTYMETGEPIVWGLLGAGQTIGESETFHDKRVEYFVKAMTVTTLCGIPMAHLRRACADNPELIGHVVNALTVDLGSFCRHLWVMNAQRVYDRIGRLFCVFGDTGLDDHEGALLLHLTHEDIAFMIHTDRPSVTRALRKMAEEGLIECRRHAIRLHDSFLPSHDHDFPYPSWSFPSKTA